MLVNKNDANKVSSNVEQYSLCRGTDDGSRMICDSEHCGTHRFHVKCLEMKHVPKGAWYYGKCVEDRCAMIG